MFEDIQVRRAWLGPELQTFTRVRHLAVSQAWDGKIKKLCQGDDAAFNRIKKFLERDSVQAEVPITEFQPVNGGNV